MSCGFRSSWYEVPAPSSCVLHLEVRLLMVSSDKQRVSDAILEKEKDKPVGQVFDGRFSWSALFDTVADVYLGVCTS